ncbi:transposase [Anaerobacillus sp. CMMVII]|uniref:transposase n=1 Tax=Anaerobacillus sp. CMMVII TaxID=2755588 RepID=UPI0021B7C2F1|nr:transposase [Anaerobacillus sp. CMMVII]MCT8138543.1 transposase [Anaerobacillus sp. CMMVII]
MDWQKREISFVVRIKKNLRLYTLQEFKPTHPSVIHDAKVLYGLSEIPIRYIEFLDEKGRSYRILTTRFDLTDLQVMEIYRNRWIIELFFKWIKQHLKLTKIWSTKPQGIWNQMFLALIAFGLSLIIKLQSGSIKTPWEFFRLLQTFLFHTVSSFIKSCIEKRKESQKEDKKYLFHYRRLCPALEQSPWLKKNKELILYVKKKGTRSI